MKHKLIAAAAASLAFSSLPIMASVASATPAPSASISSVTFTNVGAWPNSWGQSGDYAAQPSTSLSPYEKATMTIHGANLGSSTAPGQIAFKVKTTGVLGLTSTITPAECPSDGTFNGGIGNGGNYVNVPGIGVMVSTGGICVSKGSANTNNGSTFTATVLGPQGNNFFMLQKKGVASYSQAALEIDFTPTGATKTVKFKNSATIDSNCGTALQTAATPGKAYTLDANGEILLGSASNQDKTSYSDVSLNVLGLWIANLCTPDAGIAAAGPNAPNTLDYPAWATNYPVTWTTTSSTGTDVAGGTHNFNGVAFGFPYTSAQPLKIYGTTQTYTLTNFDKKGLIATPALGCDTTGTTQPAGLHKNNIHCDISTKGVVTITDTVDITEYSAGDTIAGPVVNVHAKGKAAGAMGLIGGNDSSEIGLGDGLGTPEGCTYVDGAYVKGVWVAAHWEAGLHTTCIAVIFGPRAGTTNATYAALSN